MKIYPSDHVIQAKEKTTPRDIPLGYIQAEERNAELAIDYVPRFMQPSETKPVDVFQQFTDPDTYFFDENRTKITAPLKRVGTAWMYSPNVTEYTPASFTYQAVLQRNGEYLPTVPYNIRVGVIENSIIGSDFTDKLIGIFSDAARRGLCPENLTINDGSATPNSLINANYKTTDFLFIGSKTGTGTIPIRSAGQDTVSIQDVLAENCNIWMAVESFSPVLEAVEDTKDMPCALQKAVLYQDTGYTIPAYAYRFNLDKVHEAYPVSDFTYLNLFVGTCPILVLKKKDAGFLILSEKDFLAKLTENTKLIYEILMQIYLQSYTHTNTRTAWITDEPVQYYLNKHNRYGQNHPTISLTQCLNADHVDMTQSMTLAAVHTSDNVTYTGIDGKSNLYFAKKKAADPAVSAGQVTILTATNTVLRYEDKDLTVYTVEDQLQLSYSEDYVLTIEPFKSSSLKLDLERQRITVPDTGDRYLLYATKDGWVLTYESAFVPDMGVQAAVFQVQKDMVLTTFDLRQRGGGEAARIENYELIDQGNILGRPYRKGTALIVRLPKKYKQYEPRITEQLRLTIASGEEPVLVWED